MKCTNCLTVMECISAINPVPNQPGRDRMDLHCVKPNSWGGRGCDVRCHMGVITEDPKEWVCHEYNFRFKHKDERYYLRGYNYLVDPYHQHRPYPLRSKNASPFRARMNCVSEFNIIFLACEASQAWL